MTPLFAIAGFGGYFLKDGFEAIEDGASTSGFGGYVYVDVIPFIDVEAGFDILGETTFSYNIGEDDISSFSLPKKAGWFVGVQRKLFKLPMVKFYYGAGLSQNKIVPNNYSDLIDNSSVSENNVENFIKDNLETKTGYFLECGARAKPWLVPISLNAKLRYNFLEGVVPNESGFVSIMIGAGYAL
jgi:hypothetical protein